MARLQLSAALEAGQSPPTRTLSVLHDDILVIVLRQLNESSIRLTHRPPIRPGTSTVWHSESTKLYRAPTARVDTTTLVLHNAPFRGSIATG